jgi:hypothetical protein
MLWQFGFEFGLMAAAELFVKPRRFWVRGPVGIGVDELGNLVEACVVEATGTPLKANFERVFHEALDMTFPHFDGRMGLPPIGRIVQSLQYLEALDPLLAEPLVVKHLGGLHIVG